MRISFVTSRGRIVIPVRLREKLGINKGTRVFFEEKGGDIVIHPATPDFYERTCGILKGGGLLKALAESRRKEKEHEECK